MHYHFDTTDETLKAWTLGLGSHPLPWEVIRKSVKEDSVSFRSLAKRKIIKECWKTGRPFYYIDTGYVGNLIKKKIFFRVVKNNVQHSQVFKCPDDRWKKIASKVNLSNDRKKSICCDENVERGKKRLFFQQPRLIVGKICPGSHVCPTVVVSKACSWESCFSHSWC